MKRAELGLEALRRMLGRRRCGTEPLSLACGRAFLPIYGSVRGDMDVAADRARDPCPLQSAISLRILRKILLVVVLRVVKPGRIRYFRRDRTHARGGEPGLVGAPGLLGGLTL